MSKFTEFFKAKATQIAITAVSASLVVGVSAGVAIHNNNKKLEAALNELTNTTITESVTESSSETTTESTTESTTASATKTTTTTEPAGDRAIQYLAEYERIKREYEKKRDKLIPLTLMQEKLAYYGTDIEESISVSEHNSLADECNAEAEKYKKQLDELNQQYQEDIENLKREYGIMD